MNIFMREMKAYRKSLFIWSVGILFLIGASMAKYAGLSTTGQSMNEILTAMPKSLQAIMGTGALDISKVSGYFGVLYIYLLLMATMHAAMLGATIIAKEERDKTAEFLFVKPVSRTSIICAKLSVAVVNIVMLNIVAGISSLYLVGTYSEGESVKADIILAMSAMLILQLLFLTIGSAIAAISKKPKLAVAISTGILLMTYILSIAIDLNKKLTLLKYLTPFKYFEAKIVMNGGGLERKFIILSLSIVIIFSLITFVFYRKKDLQV
ncbi:ABC transporter permease subunit [Lysinibacillus parviboronicapiens]|uniref:ABC transporter permease subunit n=1 Tax=Lysinibacillus parviboronicapiens TaxID=436516 RepID=UPI000D386EEB|nr:ABC transporter permease subunit [Lysinibacillus parviboronicapiens]